MKKIEKITMTNEIKAQEKIFQIKMNKFVQDNNFQLNFEDKEKNLGQSNIVQIRDSSKEKHISLEEYNDLQQKYNLLKSDNDLLQQNFMELEIQIESLKGLNEQLLAEAENLQKKVNDYRSRIPDMI